MLVWIALDIQNVKYDFSCCLHKSLANQIKKYGYLTDLAILLHIFLMQVLILLCVYGNCDITIGLNEKKFIFFWVSRMPIWTLETRQRSIYYLPCRDDFVKHFVIILCIFNLGRVSSGNSVTLCPRFGCLNILSVNLAPTANLIYLFTSITDWV